MLTQAKINKGMMDFIKRSPTAFQAVASMQEELVEDGYMELNEQNKWTLKKGGKYFVKRGESSIIAFKLTKGDRINSGFNIVGAHTDSPALKVKPIPEIKIKNYLQLGVEIYGGVILPTWFDRDLSLAGQISYLDKKGNLQTLLLDFKRSVGTIPSLAIHMDRSVNENRTVNKQLEMPPLLMQLSEADAGKTFVDILSNEVKKQKLDSQFDKILDYDMFFYDFQDPSFVGLNSDFIASSRLDNLLSCYIGLQSLLNSGSKQTNVLVCNDHEECGSDSRVGASGTFLKDVLERITGNGENFIRAIASSTLISSDNAHALHPNYTAKHDPTHGPLINGGPVIKINANQKYATNCQTSAMFMQLCQQADVPFQKFVARSDMPCGSTIGPITSTGLGIKTLDIGAPTFGMHSIRELVGASDPFYMYKVLSLFLS